MYVCGGSVHRRKGEGKPRGDKTGMNTVMRGECRMKVVACSRVVTAKGQEDAGGGRRYNTMEKRLPVGMVVHDLLMVYRSAT